MKKILGLTIAALLVIVVIGGGTWAFFQDNEIASGNMVAAGTLDLSINGENPWVTAPVSLQNVKPGDYGVITMTLKNDGTIEGSLTVDFKNLVDAPGSTPEAERTPDNGELSSKMDIKLWVDANGDGDDLDEGDVELYYGKLINYFSYAPQWIAGLDSGEIAYLSLSYYISTDVGNEIQGDICTFDIEFVLEQIH